MNTPSLTLKSEYSEHGHKGATEIRQSWDIELSADRRLVVMIARYSKTHEPSDRVIKRSEERIVVSVDELISFFEQRGKRA